MPGFFIYNGKYFPNNTPVIGPDSRAFRYGDGIFETIRVVRGQIPLSDYHFNRCFSGMQMLGFEIPALFTWEMLKKEIVDLCRKNKHFQTARVRISFFRGEGGIFDPISHRPNYIIQTWELPENYTELNSNGLELLVYPAGRKSCDQFSNLKSNNALLYLMAAKYAKDNKCNEALILNSAEKIADATIANIFWIKAGRIFTNPLTDGIVAGVMRQYIIDYFRNTHNPVIQQSINEVQLAEADEIFLTNALYGLRWVGAMGNKAFGQELIRPIYRDIIRPLFG
jgi:branched-chain amino acid aminotransferase